MASNVWKHFKIHDDQKYAKCNLCGTLISRGGSSKSTSNMLKHLNKVHHIIVGSSSKPSSTDQGTPQGKPSSDSATSKIVSFFQPQSKPSSSHSLSSSFKVSESAPEQSNEGSICNLPAAMETDRPTGTMHFDELHVEIDPDDPLELGALGPTSATCSSAPSKTLVTSPGSSSSLSTLPSLYSEITSQVSPTESQMSSRPIQSSERNYGLYPKTIKLGSKKKQQTVDSLFDRATKFKSSDPRAKKITNLICEMICLDLQPMSVVENKGFKRLVNHLEPRYTVPSRKTFSNKVLVDMYNEVYEKVKEELHSANYVAITTDMWTSIANEDYMAVTAHFYSGANYALKITHRCLEVVPFTEASHTADNLKNFLLKVLDEWDVTAKVVAVVRDNGTDITAAIQRSQFQAIPCVAHTLQLVVKDGLINNPKMTNLLKKTKKLVGSFKHSAKNTKMLKSCQIQLGLPQHRMIQDEPTRWNSTYYMLRRVLEQKEAIILVSSKSEVKLSVEMYGDDRKTMEFAISILEIFEQATLQVSKASSSISEVIPLINTVKSVVENTDFQCSGLLGVKNDLMASLRRRYPDVEDNLTYACATVLDPRFKGAPFCSGTAFEKAKAKIKEEMVLLSQSAATSVTEPLPEASSSTSDTSKAGKGLWAHYKDYFGQNVEQVDDDATSCESELVHYLGEKNMDPKDGEKVSHYWSNSVFQKLKSVAFKYLCIPPCTVYSERLFSTAGNICDAKRNRLDPERVKMLVFLNKNIE